MRQRASLFSCSSEHRHPPSSPNPCRRSISRSQILLKNPKCMEQVRKGLDDIMDGDEAIAPYAKVKNLPYLRACIDESLRMLPSVIFGLPLRTPAQGAPILDDYIAGDTSVSMSAYVVHHQESIFRDYDTYKPERWLRDKGKALQLYFVPYSTGARGCIGRNISYLEQAVLLLL